MDETSGGRTRCRGEEAVGPKAAAKTKVTSEREPGERQEARSDPRESSRRIVEHGADCQASKRISIVLASDGRLTRKCSSRGASR